MISRLFYLTGRKIPTYLRQLMMPCREPLVNTRAPMIIVHGISTQTRARCMLIIHASWVHFAERFHYNVNQLFSAGFCLLQRLEFDHGGFGSGTFTRALRRLPVCGSSVLEPDVKSGFRVRVRARARLGFASHLLSLCLISFRSLPLAGHRGRHRPRRGQNS